MRLLKKKGKSIPLNKQKEIFHNLVAERTGEIEKLNNGVNFQNFIYHFKCPTKHIYFNDLIDAETLFDDAKSKKIGFEDVRTGVKKSNKQLSKIENITKL